MLYPVPVGNFYFILALNLFLPVATNVSQKPKAARKGSPCDNRFASMFASLFKLCLFESLLAFFYLEPMYQRVCFSVSVQKKVTIEKLSKELYFLNSVQETMSKRNFPKNCV